MKYLLLCILFISSFSFALETDEVCYTDMPDIKVKQIKNIDIIMTKTDCGPLIAKLTDIPFKVNLYVQSHGDYAEITYRDFIKENDQDKLDKLCIIFPNLIEIMMNGNEILCNKSQ